MLVDDINDNRKFTSFPERQDYPFVTQNKERTSNQFNEKSLIYGTVHCQCINYKNSQNPSENFP